METLEKTHGLAWVEAAGGPELKIDGFSVEGMPEHGWWVWPDATHMDQRLGLELSLHTPWIEPTIGLETELLVHLKPNEEGCVAWGASVMLGKASESEFPSRGRGVARNFSEAYAAAMAWRPQVQVINGLTLWTDPESGDGERTLASGRLTWRKVEAKVLTWRFELSGLDEVIRACGAFGGRSINGESANAEQMLADVAEARERVRAAMRKFLIEF